MNKAKRDAGVDKRYIRNRQSKLSEARLLEAISSVIRDAEDGIGYYALLRSLKRELGVNMGRRLRKRIKGALRELKNRGDVVVKEGRYYWNSRVMD